MKSQIPAFRSSDTVYADAVDIVSADCETILFEF